MGFVEDGESGESVAQDWAREPEDWLGPTAPDLHVASPARMYDYALGGKDNFAVDREALERLLVLAPTWMEVARANRDFLVRAVRYLTDHGVSQFLDLGSGLPTSPNVHEMARWAHPDARVVYVDYDPVVLTYHRALLDTDPGVVTVQHDLSDPGSVLSDPAVRGLIDLDRPVGLLMVAVLHFVDIAVAPDVVREYVRRLAAGSYLVISAASGHEADPALLSRIRSAYQDSSLSPLHFRSPGQIEELFDTVKLVGAGLTGVIAWPQGGDDRTGILAGVGRKG